MAQRSLVALFCFLIFTSSASAEIPQIINFQGKVTDTGGTPISDGDYSMTFTIYDAETSGTSQWSSGGMTVAVSNGTFSVLLGDTGQPTLNLGFNQDYWMEIDIDGDIQSPRSRLGSVGYAFMASGLVAGTEVIGSVASGTNAAIKGTNTATSGYNYGVYGESSSIDGRGVYGYTGAVYAGARGVHGESDSKYGFGVYGHATSTEIDASTCGVFGKCDSYSGFGVYGKATHTSGANWGVHGRTYSGNGEGVWGVVDATSGTGVGVFGASYSTDGRGVHGSATATSGETYGVVGWNSSTSGRGVYGNATATSGAAYGVYGESASSIGRGVYGHVTDTSGLTYGVYGSTESTEGRGVMGFASQTTGSGQGVRGVSESTTNGVGVYGLTTNTNEATTTYGVFGRTHRTTGDDAGEWAVYAAGDIGYSGDIGSVVMTSRGATRLYCHESPESWLEDFGEGQLIGGQCYIELDPLFLETITIDESNPMKVYVTPNGSLGEWWVEKGVNHFSLVAKNANDGTRFDYRIVAKRKGSESKRLDHCRADELDPFLNPALLDKEHVELERERNHMKENRLRMEGEEARFEEIRLRHQKVEKMLSEMSSP